MTLSNWAQRMNNGSWASDLSVYKLKPKIIHLAFGPSHSATEL